MKYVIAAVPYSDNLGDGIIADNLRFYFKSKNIETVEVCDISYRDQVPNKAGKAQGFNLFVKLPSPIRKLMVLLFFSLKYLRVGRVYLKRKLVAADKLVIGGGQLISDVDLNFPFKLYLLIRLAEKNQIPTQILSVGVANKWSWLGKKLMSRVLHSKVLDKISVRDQVSRDNMFNFFGVDSDIIPDPALMSASLNEYTQTPIKKLNKTLGLGIADLQSLNYSGDIKSDLEANSVAHLVSVIKFANHQGYQVQLFTNGAAEDEAYLYDIVLAQLVHTDLEYSVQPRCQSSIELVNFIRSTDLIISHRLHANIVAFSFKIPSFSVGWDSKVISFFSLVGYEDRVFQDLQSLADELPKLFSSDSQIEFDFNQIETQYANLIDDPT
ncbi:polysaccharide pyruvyl transferase family protein [Catenovulum adriaticum]|uniref:Polysaccharide pyruvyl transferase family protein n=1 Tax=Catenovulum adriaticum TaxID=2984846 RepID=A0ABY7AN53_9ALTE|nr:polysaccharide pyruvyl transferase family protein [Catenovulum sp. TS8]WAJ70979.1 polysaccharide pyruvyl transferase family protein [Catenovulum sp. TS8]